MSRPLIDSTIITYEVTVSEDDLRKRLADQVSTTLASAAKLACRLARQ